MNVLNDVITYVRRIIKSPSNSSITDNMIIDYINRFWLMDIDARMQLFDFKTKYIFQTIPGITDYNIPLYSPQIQPGTQTIAPFPVYQGFFGPVFFDGIESGFYTQREPFSKIWPNYTQQLSSVAQGDGSTFSFSFTLPYSPAIPGHIDVTGIMALYNVSGEIVDPLFQDILDLISPADQFWVVPTTSVYPAVTISYTDLSGNNVNVIDSGQFLTGDTGGQLYGLLVQNTGSYPNGLATLGTYSTTSNTVNYQTGQVNVTFATPPPMGAQIQAQCVFFQPGIPRALLYYDNVMSIRPPPNTQYTVEIGAYLTPAAFLGTTQAIQFGYMSEYIARGAAQKILSDTGDWDQYNAYEPIFMKQELLVWKRSQRQITSTRTQTIFSEGWGQSPTTNMGTGVN